MESSCGQEGLFDGWLSAAMDLSSAARGSSSPASVLPTCRRVELSSGEAVLCEGDFSTTAAVLLEADLLAEVRKDTLPPAGVSCYVNYLFCVFKKSRNLDKIMQTTIPTSSSGVIALDG